MLILFLIFSFHPDICQPGWGYFEGYCYFTSLASLPWLTAESNCSAMGSQLVTIHNQEKNVYVQHRHNGERSLIGLNDRSVEGSFVWTKEARLILVSSSAVGVTRVILLLKRDLICMNKLISKRSQESYNKTCFEELDNHWIELNFLFRSGSLAR